MRLYDAHNHLQDERLRPWLPGILASLPELGVTCAVVNGTREEDWEAVARLARAHAWIKPSFGLHPWHVKTRSPCWRDALLRYLTAFPDAGVGEIGLDRWISDPDLAAQDEVFREQMSIAHDLDRPVSIHCLRAWGALEKTLASGPIPRRGFLLHSYGGPMEMVPAFVAQGARFSLSPYFSHERKLRQAATFAAVPIDRLLAESDAPDMRPPDALNSHVLRDADGSLLNHPANLLVSYQQLAKICDKPIEVISARLEENFLCLFGAGASSTSAA